MNKVCIVSGCSKGIGRGIAMKLVNSGYSLGLLSRDMSLLESLKSDLEKARVNDLQRFSIQQCDVRDDHVVK